ncbi:MAG: AgmX/PglI C-terminal domain-containing protein [Deltaproteobacteria bacterium]|nr:AgmX/PglI C-terminal domain-containing protein [Deltaproteobacteria bacterium]
MFVLQIFVMRNGALESVEMACGDRIVIGPEGAEVPLAGAGGAAVALTLHGERIVATPLSGAVRIDGEVAEQVTAISASSELCLGAVAVKVRRPSVARAAPATVELGEATARAATVPDAPVLVLATTVVEEPEAALAPFACLVDDGEAEEEEEEPDWSLVDALARPLGAARGGLVEVIRSEGERVLEHALLDGGEVFALGGRALVRRLDKGGCEITLPPGAAARARRGGELTDVLAGPTPVSLVLATGDAATVRVGAAVLLVRFAERPRVFWSAAERLARRAEQRAQAWCASAGLALTSAWAGTMWLLEYRDRELAMPLDDDDITQWPDFEMEMKRPPPEVEPVPEPMPEPTPGAEPAPARELRPKSPKAPAADRPKSVLDVAAGLPALKTNRAVDAARANMRAPLPARPGGLIIAGQIERGPGTSAGSIGGSGLNTAAGSQALAKGAGALTRGEGRAIGGTVGSGKLRDLRVAESDGLSREQILKVINAHIGQIQSCYERGLRDDPGIAGRVQVAWTITPAGEVSVTRIQTSTLGSAAVEQCMLDRIGHWRFPAARTRSQVVFPFSFSAL